MWKLLVLLANDPPKQPPQPGPFGGGGDLLFILSLFLLFYLLVLRPMGGRQERERQALLASLKKNDKVLTTGGIYGWIVSVSDKEDEVIVKVDDNTRLRMTKASIYRNLSNEEAKEAAKAQKETKEGGKSSPVRTTEPPDPGSFRKA